MANGYTVCIDINKLIDTKETINSIKNCFSSADLENTFLELNSYLRNLNFEHGSFSNTYNYLIASALEKLEEVKNDLEKLNVSLGKTIDYFDKEGIPDKEGLKNISNIYEGTTSSLNINELLEKDLNIKITSNSKIFGENIDSTIEGFMIRNNITDYPSEFHSAEDWEQNLIKEYENLNLTEDELANQIDYDMAIWRQEQTASKVTNVAESSYAFEQATINDYRDNYMEEFNIDRENATYLANLKEEINTLHLSNASKEEISNLENTLKATEDALGINYRKLDFDENTLVTSLSNYNSTDNQVYNYSEPSNITRIEPPEINLEDQQIKEPINTVPIGLGIAAAGISGAVGTVLVTEHNEKIEKENRLISFKEEDTEENSYTYEPDNLNDSNGYGTEEPPVQPYHASHNNNINSSIYGSGNLNNEEDD